MDYPSTISHDGQGHTWTIPLKDTLQLNVQSLKTRHIPWPGEAQPDAPKARDRVAGGLWDGARKKSNIVVCSFVCLLVCACCGVCASVSGKAPCAGCECRVYAVVFSRCGRGCACGTLCSGKCSVENVSSIVHSRDLRENEDRTYIRSSLSQCQCPDIPSQFFLDGGTCEVRSSPPDLRRDELSERSVKNCPRTC